MFKKNGIEPLAQHVYLSSPTMHGEEFQYMTQTGCLPLEPILTRWRSVPAKRLAANMP